MRIIIFSYVNFFAEALSFAIKAHSKKIEVSLCQTPNNLAKEVMAIKPDIVLVDVTSKQALLDTQAAYMSCPRVAFVALAATEVSKDIIACADAGFIAYIPRATSILELVELMDKVLVGECPCAPKIANSLLQEVRRRKISNHNHLRDKKTTIKPLTFRESEILEWLNHGLTNKGIARELSISVSTVKNHLNNIFTKLQVNGRVKALMCLKENPWLINIETGISVSLVE